MTKTKIITIEQEALAPWVFNEEGDRQLDLIDGLLLNPVLSRRFAKLTKIGLLVRKQISLPGLKGSRAYFAISDLLKKRLETLDSEGKDAHYDTRSETGHSVGDPDAHYDPFSGTSHYDPFLGTCQSLGLDSRYKKEKRALPHLVGSQSAQETEDFRKEALKEEQIDLFECIKVRKEIEIEALQEQKRQDAEWKKNRQIALDELARQRTAS